MPELAQPREGHYLRSIGDGALAVLELIARGADLEQILTTLVLAMEERFDGLIGSILRIDAEKRMHHVAAPHLPPAFLESVDGVEIGPTAGSCGAAAYLKQPVVAEDTLTHPAWADHRDLALRFGLRACWSSPILATDGHVLGTFAMYYTEPRAPSAEELRLTHLAAQLAAIALEREEAQAHLRATEALFGAAFDAAPVSILIVALDDGVVQAANVHLRTVFGLAREDIVGRPIAEVGLWEDLELRQRHIDELASRGRSGPFEAVLLTRSGERLPHIVSMCAAEFGGRACTMTAATDISERKRAAEALRESEEQLRQAQKMDAVGRLAGGIAHDFNNLLTAIGGYAELLLDRAREEDRADLEQVFRATERASALTKQLVAFTRRQVVDHEPLDLNDVVRDMEQLLRRLIGGHVTLETSLASGLPPVVGDRSQLEQVIVNLAVNARDAMPDGGTLRITTDAGDTSVRLRVSDTGTGMPETVVAHVFEPFFTTKEVGRGSGLGLSTVLGIVEQSGGAITVDSTPGLGTTFEVTLPAAPSEEVVAPPERRTRAPDDGGDATILVVDDDEVIRTLVARTLREHGYRVLEAGTGREAFALWGQHRGDVAVILSDVVMPAMGGVELVERVAAEDPAVRLVLMSGFADAAAPAAARDIAGFLEKPFTLEELLRVVKRAVEGQVGRR